MIQSERWAPLPRRRLCGLCGIGAGPGATMHRVRVDGSRVMACGRCAALSSLQPTSFIYLGRSGPVIRARSLPIESAPAA